MLSCSAPNVQALTLLPRLLVAAELAVPSPYHSRNYIIVTLLRDSTLGWAAHLGSVEHNLAEVERFSSDLIELSTRHHFTLWMAIGIYRGWARSASDDTAEGIPGIEQGIRDLRATGTVLSPAILPGAQGRSIISRGSYLQSSRGNKRGASIGRKI